jgi:hypothetical protein
MIGLYFGGQWFQTAFGNLYGNIELDAALDENHEWSAEATSNPVEVGAPVTDHVIDQSDKLRIRGFVTDTPLTSSPSLPQISRSQDVFDLLYELIKLKEPMTVYTKHKIYDDMVLTNVTIPRAAGVGEAIEFSAEFINIRKVATQMVDVPDGINPKKDKKADAATGKKTEPQKDGGKKQAQTVEKPSSTLSRVLK